MCNSKIFNRRKRCSKNFYIFCKMKITYGAILVTAYLIRIFREQISFVTIMMMNSFYNENN